MTLSNDKRGIVALTTTTMMIIAIGILLLPIPTVNANSITTLSVSPSSVVWDESDTPDDTVEASVSVAITTSDTYTIVIEWGDGGLSFSTADLEEGTTTFSATHAYASDAVGSQTITARLLDIDDVEIDSTSEGITVEAHDTSLTITNAIPSTAWGESITVDTHLEDITDEVPISDETVVIGGDIVTPVPVSSSTTNVDGAFSATGASAGAPIAPRTVTADYAGTPAYNPDSAEADYTQLVHETAISINDIPDTLWGDVVTASGLVTDTTLDGAGIEDATVEVSGDIDATSATTDSTGLYTVTGASPPAPVGTRSVTASYGGLADTYAPAATPANADYDATRHLTSISLDAIPSTPWNNDVTASGLVMDESDSVGIVDALVTIGGDGLGALFTTEVSTTAGGQFSSTGPSAGPPGGVTRTVTASATVDPTAYESPTDDSTDFLALKHETDVTLTALASKKWHEPFMASATLVDLDAASAEIPLKTIVFAGTGVKTSVIASTSSPAEADLIASQNTGNQDVTATFAEDSDYLESGDTQPISIEKHDTAIVPFTTPDSPTKWHYGFTAYATLTDADVALADPSTSTPEFLAGRSLDFAGSAVNTEGSFDTDEAGLATASLEAAQDTGTETVTVSFTPTESVFAPATASDSSLYNAAPTLSNDMSIDRHATEIQELTVPASVKWHHGFEASSKLVDLDAAGADVLTTLEPPGKSILFAGSAVKTPVPALTSSPAIASLIASQDTGTEIVTATFAEEAVSEGPEENGLYYGDDASTTMIVDRHTPVVSIDSASVPDTQFWELPIAPAGSFVDPESGLIATNLAELGTKPITFTGTGVGTVGPTSTAAGGGYGSSGLAPGTPCVHDVEELIICNADLEIIANFAEEPVVDENEETLAIEEVNGLFYGDSSDAEIYDTLQHITSITLGAITISPATDTTFEFDGILFDDTFAVQLPGKVITFGGTGSTPSMAPVTTAGVTFSHPDADGIQIVDCTTDCNTANKVLYLKEGGTITFPEETNQVSLSIDGMGTTPFEYEVTQFTGPAFSDTSAGAAPLISQVGILNGVDDLTGVYHGISSITITSVGPDVGNPEPGYVAIAGLTTSNIRDNPVAPRFDLQFEDQAAGSMSSLTLAEGSYFNDGSSATDLDADLTTDAIEPFGLVATFDEFELDPDYVSSSAASSYITIANTNGVAGEGTATISAANGATITTLSCGTSDSDLDAICNTWDAAGGVITYTEGASSGTYVLSTSHGTAISSTKDDVYVEIDYMSGHTPDANAIADVVAKFNAASPGVTLHVVVDEAIPHLDVLNYWTDADSDLTNDYDNLKKTWFGTSAERNIAGDDVSLREGNLKLKAKAQVYRYGIYAHCIGSSSGPSGSAELKGNDFILGMGCGFTEVGGHSVGSRNEQAGTLMHEMGHLLGLRHGGDEDTNCMPDYRSVMSYSRQLPSIKKPDGTIVDLLGANWLLDYSNVLPTPNPLNELALNEATGLASSPPYTMIWGTPTLSTKIRTALTATNINWNGDSITGTATMDASAKSAFPVTATPGVLTTPYSFKISGVKITTTGATSGSIVFTMTATFAATPGTISASTLTAAVSTTLTPLKSASITAGTLDKVVTGSTATRTFTITYPFSTSGAVTNAELGTILVTFKGTALTTLSGVTFATGSPLNTIQVDMNNMSDVNCPGTGTSHTPYNDWANLSFNQRSGLPSMDGASVKGSATGQYVSTYPNKDEKIEPDRGAREDLALAAGTYSGVLSPLIEASSKDLNAVFASVNYKSTIPFQFILKNDQGQAVTNAEKLLLFKKLGANIDNDAAQDFTAVPLPTSQASTCNPLCLFTHQSDGKYQFNLKTDQLGSKTAVAGNFWGFKFADKTTGEVLEPTGQLFDGYSAIVYIKVG